MCLSDSTGHWATRPRSRFCRASTEPVVSIAHRSGVGPPGLQSPRLPKPQRRARCPAPSVRRPPRSVWRLSAPVGAAIVAGVLPSGVGGADAATVTPPPRIGATMASDASSATSVLFGGSRSGVLRNDTWAWNGSAWQKRKAATRPPVRYGAAMASDPDTKGVVLFGGKGDAADDSGQCCLNRGDTWSWRGSAGTWTQRSPAVSPPARSWAAMASDKANGNVVLFGGFTGNALSVCTPSLADTWLWDGAAGTWTQASPATSPPPRYFAATAYDGATGTVVLFGGVVLGGSVSTCGRASNDTWVWDGSTGTWTQVTPPVSPPARDQATMSYDKARRKVVLYGGTGVGGAQDTATWLWDGVTRTWSQAETTTSPGPVRQAAMDYHGPSQKTVLFGGVLPGSEFTLNEATWTWNSLKWRKW
ncbi:MAG: Kelch repeat-containing protein [Acidimicrobiales bacterium]